MIETQIAEVHTGACRAVPSGPDLGRGFSSGVVGGGATAERPYSMSDAQLAAMDEKKPNKMKEKHTFVLLQDLVRVTDGQMDGGESEHTVVLTHHH